MADPLDYGTPPDSSPLRGLLGFLCIAVVAGGLYFAFADFHAYVGTDAARWPKFEMALPWRIAESSVVGAAAAGAILIGLSLIRRRRPR